MATEVEREFLVIGDDSNSAGRRRSVSNSSGLSVIHDGNGDPCPHCRRCGSVSDASKARSWAWRDRNLEYSVPLDDARGLMEPGEPAW